MTLTNSNPRGNKGLARVTFTAHSGARMHDYVYRAVHALHILLHLSFSTAVGNIRQYRGVRGKAQLQVISSDQL